MKRTLVAAVSACLLLVGCGSGPREDADTVAQDPQPTTSAPSTPTAEPTDEPTEEPTEEPTVGTYPDFEPRSYSYTLGVSCFCADVGPVDITVEDGKVVTAVYAASTRGSEKGDPAPSDRRLTINDVIEQANNTSVDSVEVEWPDGQDYPDSVFLDPNAAAVDDEIGYTITDVVIA